MRWLILFLLLSICPPAFGHGVECEVIRATGTGLRVVYSDGNPAVGADVEIYAPGNYKKPHLLAKTNDRGEFLFLPDKPGLWIAIAKDAFGHMARREISVDEKMMGVSTSQGGGITSLSQKIVMALSVVWGLIGTALFFMRKKGK